MARARVAILRTRPETVLEDYRRLGELAGLKAALDPSAGTILKDNITWHFVFPGVNTTPWQLEGTILALHDAGLRDLTAVHNHTVVTIAERGEEELKFTPIYRRFGVPVLFNFREDDDLAVARDHVQGLAHDDVAGPQRRTRRPVPPSRPAGSRFAVTSVFVRRSESACALPRASAIASAKLANSTVNQSQTAIWMPKPDARARR